MTKKLTLKLPKLHLPTWLLITIPALVVVLALAYGIVRNDQARQAEQRAYAQQIAAEKAQADATNKASHKVQADLNTANAKVATACGALKTYSVQATTKKYVTVPAVCN